MTAGANQHGYHKGKITLSMAIAHQHSRTISNRLDLMFSLILGGSIGGLIASAAVFMLFAQTLHPLIYNFVRDFQTIVGGFFALSAASIAYRGVLKRMSFDK